MHARARAHTDAICFQLCVNLVEKREKNDISYARTCVRSELLHLSTISMSLTAIYQNYFLLRSRFTLSKLHLPRKIYRKGKYTSDAKRRNRSPVAPIKDDPAAGDCRYRIKQRERERGKNNTPLVASEIHSRLIRAFRAFAVARRDSVRRLCICESMPRAHERRAR